MSLNHPGLPLRTLDLEAEILRAQAGAASLRRSDRGSAHSGSTLGAPVGAEDGWAREALAATTRVAASALVALAAWVRGGSCDPRAYGPPGEPGTPSAR